MKRLMLVLLVLILSISACGSSPSKTAAQPVVLHIGWLGKPDTLNPAYAFLVESTTIFDLVYSTLVKEGPDGKYTGCLAKSWKHSDDGLVWTFTLKEGIKWHNGESLTAKDVVWSIEAPMTNPEWWSTISNYVIGFKTVKALDDKTVEITLEKPVSNMEYRVSYLYTMFSKDFEKFKTAEELQNFNNFNTNGSGPFKIQNFDKEKGILVLGANADYFDGKPFIDQVIFQTFENSDAMVQALKVGDIELMTEVPSSAFETVKGFPNVTAIESPARGITELIINSVPASNDPAPKRNPALEDPQVRLALETAMNKQDLVDVVLQGFGEVGTTIIPPVLGGGFWHSTIQNPAFDLKKAAQILEDAGYKLGADGVRSKGDIRLEFRLQFASDSSNYPRVADLLTGWYKEIGVKTIPQSVDPDSLTASVTPTGDYDLVIWGWGSDPDPDFMLSVMTSGQFIEGGWSDSGYSNPEYDALYLKQQTILDPNERQKIVWQMQDMVFNDRPYIVLYYDASTQAYRSDKFKDFIVSPLGLESSISLSSVKPIK
ncbi:MAG: ABC transporter substrate-binding protein [Chloroflexota bacterium]